MLNLCVFIFVIYAVSYSARVILFGKSDRKRKRAYCTSKRSAAETKIEEQRHRRRKPNVVKLSQKKSGRMGKAPVRPVALLY